MEKPSNYDEFKPCYDRIFAPYLTSESYIIALHRIANLIMGSVQQYLLSTNQHCIWLKEHDCIGDIWKLNIAIAQTILCFMSANFLRTMLLHSSWVVNIQNFPTVKTKHSCSHSYSTTSRGALLMVRGIITPIESYSPSVLRRVFAWKAMTIFFMSIGRTQIVLLQMSSVHYPISECRWPWSFNQWEVTWTLGSHIIFSHHGNASDVNASFLMMLNFHWEEFFWCRNMRFNLSDSTGDALKNSFSPLGISHQYHTTNDVTNSEGSPFLKPSHHHANRTGNAKIQTKQWEEHQSDETSMLEQGFSTVSVCSKTRNSEKKGGASEMHRFLE